MADPVGEEGDVTKWRGKSKKSWKIEANQTFNRITWNHTFVMSVVHWLKVGYSFGLFFQRKLRILRHVANMLICVQQYGTVVRTSMFAFHTRMYIPVHSQQLVPSTYSSMEITATFSPLSFVSLWCERAQLWCDEKRDRDTCILSMHYLLLHYFTNCLFFSWLQWQRDGAGWPVQLRCVEPARSALQRLHRRNQWRP